MTRERTIALVVLFGVALCLTLAVVSFAGKCEKEEEVTLDQCPAAVQATLKEQAKGGTIDEIEKVTEDGKVIYEAEITKDGKEYEVEIAEDGTLLETELDDGDDDDNGHDKCDADDDDGDDEDDSDDEDDEEEEDDTD